MESQYNIHFNYKLILHSIFIFFVILMCLYIIPFGHETHRHSEIFYKLSGAFLLVIFIPIELMYLNMLFGNKYALKVTQNGFKYNWPFSNKKEVLWKKINKIDLVHLNNLTYIGISFFDNDEYIDNLTLLDKYIARSNSKKLKYPILLGKHPFINITLDSLVTILQKYHAGQIPNKTLERNN